MYAGVPGFCRLLESGVYVRGFSVCRVALGLRVTIVWGLVYAGVPGFCRLPKCGYGFSVLGFMYSEVTDVSGFMCRVLCIYNSPGVGGFPLSGSRWA